MFIDTLTNTHKISDLAACSILARFCLNLKPQIAPYGGGRVFRPV